MQVQMGSGMELGFAWVMQCRKMWKTKWTPGLYWGSWGLGNAEASTFANIGKSQ